MKAKLSGKIGEKIKKVKRLRKRKERERWSHLLEQVRGAKDLITVRGQRLLEEADIVIYAGSLVNPKLLYGCKETCAVYNSAKMTLEEVLEVIKEGETQRKNIVRLHTGDPCLYRGDQRADG